MATLDNRPHTALLIVDMQNGVVSAVHGRDAAIRNVGIVIAKARQAGIPVVWVRHASEQLCVGTDRWQIVSELVPADAEPLIAKRYGDAFEDTNLEDVLAGLGVGRLVVVGAQTDECIRSTIHGAMT